MSKAARPPTVADLARMVAETPAAVMEDATGEVVVMICAKRHDGVYVYARAAQLCWPEILTVVNGRQSSARQETP